ncbi:MAG: hypothetical protein ACT4O6_24760 [Reyranella sp.]
MDIVEISDLRAGSAEAATPGGSPSDSLARALRGPVKRRTPPRLKVFFLRQLRQRGEVSLAAKRTGVPLSTVYRWRERDPKFRGHWDTLLAQRRQIAEDRLMAIIREGELHTVYYKGLEVGLRRTFTHRVAVRALDYFDRRANAEIRHSVSRSEAAELAKKAEESAA